MPVSPRVVLTDIEGTTTPIAFVHDVLFPHARKAMPALIARASHMPEVAAVLAEIERLAPGCDPLAQLLEWMDDDAKVTPLKALQGIAWRDGYASGELVGALYPDVAPALQAWHAAGVALAVYSSGSVAAQRLIFGYSAAGDLVPLFDGFFDTRIGAKRETASYQAIVGELAAAAGSVLFLSDVEAELDAAASAGLLACQLVRQTDGTRAGTRYPVAADFAEVAHLFGLPAVPVRFASRAAPANPDA